MLRGAKRPWLLALLAYMVLAAVLLAPSIRPGRTVVPVDILEAAEPFRSVPPAPALHNPLPSDAAFQFLGWYSWMGRELRTGHIPQWNPEILAGVPLEPNGNVSPYYPPMWFVRWLHPFDAYNAFVWFHLVLGAMGAYAFGRRLGASAVPAIVAGAAAMTAGIWIHLSTHLVHLASMTWVGLALAAAHGAATAPARRGPWVAALAGTIAMTALAAGTQFTYFVILSVGGYATVLACVAGTNWRGRARGVGLVGGGIVLGLALAAPLLLPGIAARAEVLRDTEPVESMAKTHLPAADLMRLLVPDWRGGEGVTAWHRTGVPEYDVDTPFVGVATIVAAVVAIARARRRPDVALALGAVALVLLLSFTEPLHRVLYGVVPSYNQFRVGARWIAILPGLAAPLAAVGLTAVLNRERNAQRWLTVSVGAAAAVLAALSIAVLVDGAAPQRYLAIRIAVAGLPLVALAALLWRRAAQTLAMSLVALAVVGEAGFHTARWYGAHREAGALPALAAADTANARGGRIIRLSSELTQIPAFAADVPLYYDVADASGWAVLFPRDYDRYMRIVEDYGDFAKLTNVAPPLTRAASLASPLLDALDVRTVLIDNGVSEAVPYPEVAADGPVRIVARPALGAAALVPEARRATEKSMWASVADPAWQPERTAAVEGLARDITGGPGVARRVAHTADTERYRVDAPQGGLLRVSGRYDEGWSARVDGKPVEVYRADGIFRAAVVPPGKHVVDWRFRNPAEETGRRVALAALLVTLLLVVVRRPQRT